MVSAATDAANKPTITHDVQPVCGPSITAEVRDARLTNTRTCPTGSNARARGAFDSGTNRAANTTAASPIGRLIQKMERQPTACVKAPPISGPIAKDTPATAPQTPTACARAFRSGNAFAMIDRATGLSMDAPSP